MESRIERISEQAKETFINRSQAAFQQHFDTLKAMVNEVTAADVNLSMDSVKTKRIHALNLLESSEFSIGIFILRDGAVIPLHDHPGMIGIIKVLYGNISVRSYTRVSEKEDFGYLIAERNDPILVSAASDPCCLMESARNIHEISAVDGHAAFLDILAPPYDDDEERKCSYYKEVNARQLDKNKLNASFVVLEKVT